MEIDHKNTVKYKIKCKLLRRDLTLDQSARQVLVYTKLKKIYFRGISERYLSSNKLYYSKSKQSIYLRYLYLNPKLKSHYLNLAKTCKNLKCLTLNASTNFSLKLLVPFIKRLSKNIEVITISASNQSLSTADIKRFFQSLGACKSLKSFHKYVDYSDEKENIDVTEKEFHCINRYFSRLSNLTEIYCRQDFGNQWGLQKYLLKNNKPCNYLITGLSFSIFDWMPGDSDESDDDNEISLIHSRIEPFFKFRLFPNLRKLELQFGEENEYLLEPFITERFKDLTRLESLTLIIDDEQKDYSHLFNGLLNLPLLKSFSLDALNLKRTEGKLLTEFLSKQSRLVYLSLCIQTLEEVRAKGQKSCEYIENICSNLNSKPDLRYLTLQASFWSLESLSNGLQKADNIENQVMELSIEVFDDFGFTSKPPVKRVEGLCNFMRRQRHSLKRLNIILCLVKEDEILDQLISAFGELTELERFSLNVNPRVQDSKCKGYLQKFQPGSLKGSPTFRKPFYGLSQALQKLSKLTELSLKLNPIIHSDDKSTINSSLIFNALPKMTHLRRLSLSLPYLEDFLAAHPSQVSLLLTLRDIVFVNIVIPKNKNIEEIEHIIKQINCRQSIRRFLTFTFPS